MGEHRGTRDVTEKQGISTGRTTNGDTKAEDKVERTGNAEYGVATRAQARQWRAEGQRTEAAKNERKRAQDKRRSRQSAHMEGTTGSDN